MDVILSKEKVDLQECGVLISGFFLDERPLRGSSGLIDWRLNGKLSRFLNQKKLTGEWKEATLIPTQRRMRPPMVLLLGLGRVREYSYLRLREISTHFLKILNGLNNSEVCLSLPYEERYNVDCGKSAEVLIEGIADCLDRDRDSFREEWINNLKLFFAEGEEWLPEILFGVETAKSILGDRLRISIFSPSEDGVSGNWE